MNNKYLAFGIAVLLLFSTVFAYSYSDLNSTMIKGWYTLDETAAGPGIITNSIGAGGTGNGTYDINVQVNQAGKIGTSFYINGLDGNASLGNNLVQNDNFSISYWFKAVPQVQNPGFTIARALGGATTTSYVFAYFNESLYYQMYNTAGTPITLTVVSGITEGSWHLVVATFNKTTGTTHLNIDNGAKGITNTAWVGTVYTGATPTWIGKDARSLVGTKWKGYVDQVTYFDTALTYLDINKLWNGGAGITFVGPHVNTLTNTITSPAIGTTQTGFMDVNFTITDTNAATATITSSIYLSATAGAKTTLVYTDANIADGTGITCNLYIPFTTARNCTYRFNSDNYTDGNYYVDINSYSVIDGNLASLGPFTINNSMDEVPPIVGPTTLSGFAQTGSFISGTGNILGGFAYDTPDYKWGSTWTILRQDTNHYFSIATNSTGQYVYVGRDDGKIYLSSNYGATFVPSTTQAGTYVYQIVIPDNNESMALAVFYGGPIAVTRDTGVTWSTPMPNEDWRSIDVSNTGKYVIASHQTSGTVMMSNNWGATFFDSNLPAGYWSSVSIDGTGKYLLAASSSSWYYTSNDYGVTWIPIKNGQWWASSISKNSSYTLLGSTSAPWYSDNYANSLIQTTSLSNYLSVFNSQISRDGQYVLFPVRDDSGDPTGHSVKIASSLNYGIDYNSNSIIDLNWGGRVTVAMSDGAYNYAATSDGNIWIMNRDRRGLDISSCQYTINNGVSWAVADWNSATTSCTKYGYTVVPGTTYTFNTRIQDLAGNYGYGTATSPYLAASGSAIQFIVRDEQLNALQDVDINFYTIVNGARTGALVSVTTDVSGVAFVILDYGTQYGMDVYDSANKLVSTTNNLTITATPYYITIVAPNNGNILPDSNMINVLWNPAMDFLYTDATQFVQTITGPTNIQDVNILFYQYTDLNATGKKIQLGSQTIPCTGGCTITTAIAAITIAPDWSKPLFIDLNVRYGSNNARVSFTHKYYKDTGVGIFDLIRNVRTDFACSKDPAYPCGGTMIVAVIIAIIVTIAVALYGGNVSPRGMILIFGIIVGVFTYLGWVYLPIFILLAVIFALVLGQGLIEQ